MAASSRADCAPWAFGTSLPHQPRLGRMALPNGRSDRSGVNVWTTSLSWARCICAESCDPMLAITTKLEHIGHWIRMRQSLARFSASVSSFHAPSWADFITTTLAFRFSVHTREIDETGISGSARDDEPGLLFASNRFDSVEIDQAVLFSCAIMNGIEPLSGECWARTVG